jgi:hypothetical protein
MLEFMFVEIVLIRKYKRCSEKFSHCNNYDENMRLDVIKKSELDDGTERLNEKCKILLKSRFYSDY